MERVAFLVERTGERIECLLNPETFTLTRQAGVRPLRTLAAAVLPAPEDDDPLLAVGGGSTELVLELLFDLSKQTAPQPQSSVQALTAPLWQLAENSDDGDGHGRPPLVRFVWGKAWNISAVVVQVAERFERFTPEGLPTRSWVKLRLMRHNAVRQEVQPFGTAPSPEAEDALVERFERLPPEDIQLHEVSGETPEDPAADAPAEGPGEGIDQLAFRYTNNPSLWPAIARFNALADPARIAAGTVLRFPRLGLGD